MKTYNMIEFNHIDIVSNLSELWNSQSTANIASITLNITSLKFYFTAYSKYTMFRKVFIFTKQNLILSLKYSIEFQKSLNHKDLSIINRYKSKHHHTVQQLQQD